MVVQNGGRNTNLKSVFVWDIQFGKVVIPAVAPAVTPVGGDPRHVGR